MCSLLNLDAIVPLLVCPRCRHDLIRTSDGCYSCCNTTCVFGQGKRFRTVGSQPALVDFDHSVLSEDAVVATGAASLIPRGKAGFFKAKLLKILFPTSSATVRNIRRFVELAKQIAPNPKVLVVGGGEVGSGTSALYGDPAVQLIAFDVYASANTGFIADGHQIPLRDQSVDAVLVQAVLEHVVDPATIVAEIYRVLRPDGVVYAETPFLQQVHEGAYDFTRFTESGHRYLFRRFSLVDSGVVQGPGTQLRWSVGHFGRSLFRSTLAEKLTLVMFFWLSYLDCFCGKREAVDGACGVYFLGTKSDQEISPKDIVKHYQGAQ